MNRNSYFRLLFLVLVALAVLHLVGLKFYLYWEIPYYDKLVHFLGSFWVAGIIVWLIFDYHLFGERRRDRFRIILIGLLGGLVVGVCWEIFEVLSGAIDTTVPTYVGDTVTDLLVDGLGSLVAVYMFFRYKKRFQSWLIKNI